MGARIQGLCWDVSIKFPRTIAGTDRFQSRRGAYKMHLRHASCRVTLLQRTAFTYKSLFHSIAPCAISFVTNRHIANERSNGVAFYISIDYSWDLRCYHLISIWIYYIKINVSFAWDRIALLLITLLLYHNILQEMISLYFFARNQFRVYF